MSTTTMGTLQPHSHDEPLDYGFRPLRNARWYKRLLAWALSATNRRYDALVAEEKRALLAPLEGTVLEIGPGGGNNLAFLRRGVHWIGVEPNPFFHDRLRARGERLGIDVDVRAATAEALPAADQSVDAVVSSLVLCSVHDPEAALREIRRVLRPGGRFVFVEHVAAPHGTGLRRVQRALAPAWGAFSDGCHPDRDIGRLIEAAGFSDVTLHDFRLPVPVMGPHIAGVARA
jgi:SAM-dependent methyltransferase